MKLFSNKACSLEFSAYTSTHTNHRQNNGGDCEMIKQHTTENLLYKIVDRSKAGIIIDRTITVLFFTITLKNRNI